MTVSAGLQETVQHLSNQAAGSSGSVLYCNVAADSTSTVGGYNTRQVRIAVGVVGATGTISGSTLKFTLTSGTTVTLVSSIMSN